VGKQEGKGAGKGCEREVDKEDTGRK